MKQVVDSGRRETSDSLIRDIRTARYKEAVSEELKR